MTRPLYLNRDEAESLVDLCEGTRDGRLWDLAAQLRGQWGMGPQAAEMPPTPAPEVEPYKAALIAVLRPMANFPDDGDIRTLIDQLKAAVREHAAVIDQLPLVQPQPSAREYMKAHDLMNYWQRRCAKAEELLMHVGCDPDWTATVSAHFDKIREGDKANYASPTAASLHPQEKP